MDIATGNRLNEDNKNHLNKESIVVVKFPKKKKKFKKKPNYRYQL